MFMSSFYNIAYKSLAVILPEANRLSGRNSLKLFYIPGTCSVQTNKFVLVARS